jgi:hypothetical protein
MALTMSMPSTTSPKTTCLPSSQLQGLDHTAVSIGRFKSVGDTYTVVTKNWDPLLWGRCRGQLRLWRLDASPDSRVGSSVGRGQESGAGVLDLEATTDGSAHVLGSG